MTIFPSAAKQNTYIEIDKDYIKVSQAYTTGKSTVISRLITEPVAGLSDEDISKALADVIKSNNIKIGRLTAIVSRERAMVRYMRLPSIDPAEINRMASFEISKQTPYSDEEIISDYKIIGSDEQGYSDIMLVISPQNELTRLYNLLSATGRKPDNIRLSSDVISSWLRISAGSNIRDKNVCLIDIDSANTELVVLSKGRLLFSRVATIGANNILESEGESILWKKRLLEEIKRSIAMYLKEKTKEAAAISEFYITGASSIIDDFSEYLKKEVDAPCKTLNALSALSLADGALSEEGVAPGTSVCAVAGSPFLEKGVNLIPQDERNKQRYMSKLRKGLIGAGCGVGVLALILIGIYIGLYQKQQRLDMLKAMLAKIEVAADETENKLKRLKVLKGEFSEEASSLDAIYNLYKLIPANISLIDFDYDDKTKSIRFRGKAMRMSDVFKLAGILEGSESFSNVQTRSVAERKTREGAVVDFQIRCNFTPGKGPK